MADRLIQFIIAHLPLAEKMAILRQTEFRARLLSGKNPDAGLVRRLERWDRIFPLGDPPDYEPAADKSIAARAARGWRRLAHCWGAAPAWPGAVWKPPLPASTPTRKAPAVWCGSARSRARG